MNIPSVRQGAGRFESVVWYIGIRGGTVCVMYLLELPHQNLSVRPIVVGVLLGLLGSAIAVSPTLAAAPPIIIVSGSLVSQPVVLADWGENILLISSGADHPIGQVEAPQGRPSLDLALFTGEQWATYVQTGQPLEALLPSQSDEHGRFYPASAGEPALLVLPEVQRRGDTSVITWSVRRMDQEGLAVLAQREVPTSSDEAPRCRQTSTEE